ncbi:MAG: SAM-dependent methyltransferase [Phycisphaerae bacterium]
MTDKQARRFVSRGGEKLAAAIDAFDIRVAMRTCLDFGSHVGGFVDCLLQYGAASVTAVDPGYGVLDYRLRVDPRVTVRERTNALRFFATSLYDLITIDVGWTPQRLVLPVAMRCLKPDGVGVITLIKPHYEAPKDWLAGGVLLEARRDEVMRQCREDVHELGWTITAEIESPLPGHGGNREALWYLRRA